MLLYVSDVLDHDAQMASLLLKRALEDIKGRSDVNWVAVAKTSTKHLKRLNLNQPMTAASAQALRKLRKNGPRKHFAQANHIAQPESRVFGTARLGSVSQSSAFTSICNVRLWFRVEGLMFGVRVFGFRV